MNKFGTTTWIDAVKNSLPEHLSYLEKNLQIVMAQHQLDEIDAHACALAAATASGNSELAFEISVNGPLFGRSERELVSQAVTGIVIDTVYLEYLDATYKASVGNPPYKLEKFEPIIEDATGKTAMYAFAAAIVLQHRRAFALVEMIKSKDYTDAQVQDIANIAAVIASIIKVT